MANKRVLIVDDDAKIVELVKMYLARDGYGVLAAYDGNTALKLAREGHPDLIVLDIMLPGVDGLEICRILREESSVPIILLTAKTTEEDRIIGLDMQDITHARGKRVQSTHGSKCLVSLRQHELVLGLEVNATTRTLHIPTNRGKRIIT